MYAYDRQKTAGAFFNNYALPRRATTGNSLTSIQATVRHLHTDFYSIEVEIRGTLKGGVQEVSDEIRMASIEMQEFLTHFFRQPASMKGSQTISTSDATVSIVSGLHMRQNVDFRFANLSPEEVSVAVASAARFFTNKAEIQMV